MTIESVTSEVTGVGDDANTSFSISPLKVYSSDDIKVQTVSSAGVYTEVTEGVGSTNYSLSLSSVPGTGTITYPASGGTPLATGEFLVTTLEPAGTQEIDLQNQTAYNAETVEKAIDLAALMALSLLAKFSRAFTVPEGETATTLPSATLRANKLLAFDSSGNPTASSLADPGALVVSAFAETFLNDADAATVLATLGFTSDAVTFVGNTLANMKTQLGLGSAAYLDAGVVEDNVVQLDSSDKLPVGVMPTSVLNSEITGTVSFDEVELWNASAYHNLSNPTTTAHSLGATPDMIPMCRFTVVDGGGDVTYSVGDTIYLSPHTTNDSSPDSRGFHLDWDATNIYWYGGRDPILIPRKGTGDYQTLEGTKWKCEALVLRF